MSQHTSPQPLVEGFSFFQIEISDWQIVVTVIVAAIGWITAYLFARRLQRRQLAITILHESFFAKDRLDAMKNVFDVVRLKQDFDWENLAKSQMTKKNKPQKPTKDTELFRHVIIILNYFEFLSVAILTNSISETIIKEIYKSIFIVLYIRTEKMISYLQTYTGDKTYFCNYNEIARKWDKTQTAKKEY